MDCNKRRKEGSKEAAEGEIPRLARNENERDKAAVLIGRSEDNAGKCSGPLNLRSDNSVQSKFYVRRQSIGTCQHHEFSKGFVGEKFVRGTKQQQPKRAVLELDDEFVKPSLPIVTAPPRSLARLFRPDGPSIIL